MGSIPLVALQSRVQEQPPDLIGNYGRLLALKQQMQMAPLQQQEAQQQVQLGQQQIQSGQQEMATRQALNAAYAGAVTKDANGNTTIDSTKLAQGLANGPAAYKTPEVMKGINDFHTGLIKMQTDMADLQSKSADIDRKSVV